MLKNKYMVIKQSWSIKLLLPVLSICAGCVPRTAEPAPNLPEEQPTIRNNSRYPDAVGKSSLNPSRDTRDEESQPSNSSAPSLGDFESIQSIREGSNRIVIEQPVIDFQQTALHFATNYQETLAQAEQAARNRELERQRGVQARAAAERRGSARLATEHERYLQRERERQERERQARLQLELDSQSIQDSLSRRMRWVQSEYMRSAEFNALPIVMRQAIENYVRKYGNNVNLEFNAIFLNINPILDYDYAPYLDRAGFEATLMYDVFVLQIWNETNKRRLKNPSNNPYATGYFGLTEEEKKERVHYMRLERMRQELEYEKKNHGRLRMNLEELFSLPEDSILPPCPYNNLTEHEWDQLVQRIGREPFYSMDLRSWMDRIKQFGLNDPRLLEVRQMLEFMLSAECPEELKNTMALTLSENGTTCLNAAETGRVQAMGLWEAHIEASQPRNMVGAGGVGAIDRAIKRTVKKRSKCTFEEMVSACLEEYAAKNQSQYPQQPEARSFMIQQLWKTFGIGNLLIFDTHWRCGECSDFYIGKTAPAFMKQLLKVREDAGEGQLSNFMENLNHAIGYANNNYDGYAGELWGNTGNGGIFKTVKDEAARSFSEALGRIPVEITIEALEQFIATNKELLKVIANHVCLAHTRQYWTDGFDLEEALLDAVAILKKVLYGESRIADLIPNDFDKLKTVFAAVGNASIPIQDMYECYLGELRESFALAQVGCMTDSTFNNSTLLAPEAIEAMEALCPGQDAAELARVANRRTEILNTRYYSAAAQSYVQISGSVQVNTDHRGQLVVEGDMNAAIENFGLGNRADNINRLLTELGENVRRANEINAARLAPQVRCAPLLGIRNQLPAPVVA